MYVCEYINKMVVLWTGVAGLHLPLYVISENSAKRTTYYRYDLNLQ